MEIRAAFGPAVQLLARVCGVFVSVGYLESTAGYKVQKHAIPLPTTKKGADK